MIWVAQAKAWISSQVKEIQPDTNRLMLASGVSIDEMTRIASKGLVSVTSPSRDDQRHESRHPQCLRAVLFAKEIEAQENRIQTLTDKLQAEQSVTQANSNLAASAEDGDAAPARPRPLRRGWPCHFPATRKTSLSPR